MKFLVCYHTFITPRRSSHEERGLKFQVHALKRFQGRRSSHEERGLKYYPEWVETREDLSLLSRGAWIEIASPPQNGQGLRSLLSRGAWIEMPSQD